MEYLHSNHPRTSQVAAGRSRNRFFISRAKIRYCAARRKFLLVAPKPVTRAGLVSYTGKGWSR